MPSLSHIRRWRCQGVRCGRSAGCIALVALSLLGFLQPIFRRHQLQLEIGGEPVVTPTEHEASRLASPSTADTSPPSSCSRPLNPRVGCKGIGIYVYQLSKQGSLSPGKLKPKHDRNFRFEVALKKLLQSHPCRVDSPENANFFFVPATPVRYYFGHRTRNKVCEACKEADAKLDSELQGLGRYWTKCRAQHIIPMLWCPQKDPWENETLSYLFPNMWASGSMQFCLQAIRNNIDERRSIHTTYYLDPKEFPTAVGQQEKRDLLAVYAGASITPERAALAEGMRSCRDCVVEILGEKGRHVSDNFLRDWRKVLKRAIFQIVPPGDTLEREARDQTLAAGAIPVWFDMMVTKENVTVRPHLPWAASLDWKQFSVNFTPPSVLTQLWPQLEAHLRDLKQSGEALSMGRRVAAFRHRLNWTNDGVGVLMLEELAKRLD